MDDDGFDAGFATILAASAAILHRVRAGRIIKRPARRRRYHVHPNNAARRTHSHFFTLFEANYHHHHDRFFGDYRMMPSSFDKLFALLESGLTKKIGPRESIGAKERLAITIYFLAHVW
jgi:hypothetical protein